MPRPCKSPLAFRLPDYNFVCMFFLYQTFLYSPRFYNLHIMVHTNYEIPCYVIFFIFLQICLFTPVFFSASSSRARRIQSFLSEREFK
jgi:hypothetical protein